jgi:hypothetical protein
MFLSIVIIAILIGILFLIVCISFGIFIYTVLKRNLEMKKINQNTYTFRDNLDNINRKMDVPCGF